MANVLRTMNTHRKLRYPKRLVQNAKANKNSVHPLGSMNGISKCKGNLILYTLWEHSIDLFFQRLRSGGNLWVDQYHHKYHGYSASIIRHYCGEETFSSHATIRKALCILRSYPGMAVILEYDHFCVEVDILAWWWHYRKDLANH